MIVHPWIMDKLIGELAYAVAFTQKQPAISCAQRGWVFYENQYIFSTETGKKGKKKTLMRMIMNAFC